MKSFGVWNKNKIVAKARETNNNAAKPQKRSKNAAERKEKTARML